MNAPSYHKCRQADETVCQHLQTGHAVEHRAAFPFSPLGRTRATLYNRLAGTFNNTNGTENKHSKQPEHTANEVNELRCDAFVSA